MATTQKPKRTPPLTVRQVASLEMAKALATATGYEILDHDNGDVAKDIAHRAVQIVDAVIAEAAS